MLSTRYFTLNCSNAKRPHELVTEEDLPATWDWWVLLACDAHANLFDVCQHSSTCIAAVLCWYVYTAVLFLHCTAVQSISSGFEPSFERLVVISSDLPASGLVPDAALCAFPLNGGLSTLMVFMQAQRGWHSLCVCDTQPAHPPVLWQLLGFCFNFSSG